LKSKRFRVDLFKIQKGDRRTINIPKLEAYSIEYYDFIINGLSGYDSCVEISNCDVIVTAKDHILYEDDRYELIIYHHGIRDYEALFPYVTNKELKKRLADFYMDTEKCFESGAWLPFSLMCGGIFEGILISQGVLDNEFCNQIQVAESRGIISSEEATIMHNVRNNRNIVHANKYSNPYIKRKEAMDIRTVLDKLIDKF